MASPRKRNQISEQFIAHPRSMVTSPAMRVLSLSEVRILWRLEVEHMAHGGVDNGRLPCTYAHFEEWGVRRRFVAPALRALEALGFIETTRKGYRGAVGTRQPSRYRLTYVRARDATGAGTHEYLKIKTLQEAKTIAAKARRDLNPCNAERSKIRFARATKCPIPGPLSGRINPIALDPLSGPTVSGPLSGPTSISRGKSRPTQKQRTPSP
jgi:hypothetical protein